MPDKEEVLRAEIIDIGRRLYDLRLVAARSGNLSARIDKENILITATGSSLGDLKEVDILKVDLNNQASIKDKRLTTEFPVHSLIHKNFPDKCVIHCHPPLVNGYFAVYPDLKALTFETKFYLGSLSAVPQDTPSITRPELVIEALKTNNLAVIKNHGVICVAEDFKGALYLIETLEEAVRVAAVARLFKKDALDSLDEAIEGDLVRADGAYQMFSREHIRAIVELVNHDEFIAKKGKELGLTVQLAIKMDGSDSVYKFNFQEGKIARLDYDADAPFVISAPKEVWEQVFLGKLDSFVAVTQGKMKLSGQLAQLSKWYVPFTRLFALFKQVKIKA